MRLFLLIAAVILIPGIAQAETITRADVDHHFDAMTALYNKPDVNNAEIADFTRHFITDDTEMTNTVYINNGAEPMVSTISGKQIVEQSEEQTLRDTAAKYQIKSFSLTEDNKFADVEYSLWLQATIDAPENTGGPKTISFTSTSDCTERFSMDGTQMKAHKSICETHINYALPPQ